MDTLLTPHKQREAIKLLIEHNFLEVKLMGIPAKNHFKVKGICFEEVNTMFIPQLRHLHIAQLNPPSY
jgi:hypothetical protein